MRVKLSYTVEEEDVLAEAAKIVNLSADDMQQIINLFTESQQELQGKNDVTGSGNVNVKRALEMIDEFRHALLNVDTRLSEVVEIIRGYDDYEKKKVEATRTETLSEVFPHLGDIYGAD